MIAVVDLMRGKQQMSKHNNVQASKEVTRHLMMTNPEEALQRINKSKAADYYKNDFEFRIRTEIQHMECDIFMQNFNAVLERGEKVLNQLSAGEHPNLLAKTCNVLGAAFLEVDLVDEVVHCFNIVIAIEEENGRTILTSVAYANIGVMYYYVEKYQDAIEMFKKAYSNMIYDEQNEATVLSIKLHTLASLVVCYSHLKQFDKAEQSLQELQKSEAKIQDQRTIRIIDCAYMAYYMRQSNFKLARRYYDKVVQPIGKYEDVFFNLRLTNFYCKVCQEYNLPYQDYIDTAQKLAESEINRGNLDEIIKLYIILIDYYESIEDTTAALACYRKLKENTKKALVFYNQLRLKAIKIRQDLEKVRVESVSFNQKNKELSMIAQEALSMRNKLQEAYNQINMISMLGSKLTTATTFRDLMDVAQEIICDKMHVSGFTILVVSDDAQHLLSLAEKGDQNSGIKISLRDIGSLFVESCLQNKIIVCSDVNEEVRRKNGIVFDQSSIESIVFMPLIYESKVIGVLSVQSIHKNAYNNEKVEFLKLISSYLSIALNNVKKSRVLVEEINLHKQTQLELEKVNLYLKNLSSLDGLTKVNNRRAFDEEYSRLIKTAITDNEPIAVIMVDIDYFKKYNDRYGHLKGDEALIKVAQKINKAFQNEKSTFARFGGEEFIAVTVGHVDGSITNLCEQIRLSIADILIENEDTASGYLTVSIGAAQMINVSSGVKSRLMRKADEMLYRAKENGRNRSEICFVS